MTAHSFNTYMLDTGIFKFCWIYEVTCCVCMLFSVEESSRDIVKKAALAVGSLSDTEFNITFNPDVFQAHVKHAQPDVRNKKFSVNTQHRFV